MPASAHHHIGLRVSDIDRAAQFYIDAFDGHWMAKPFTLSGEFAEIVMDGPPGVAFKVCMVGFEDGGCVKVMAEQVAHQIVVALAVHARFDVRGIDSVALEITLPGQGVGGHGIDDFSVQVEQ